MIEAKLALFQVIEKLIGAEPIKLLHAPFGKGPETLDAVDMISAVGKFVIAMTDSKMFCKTDIDEAVITPPAVGMDNHLKGDFTANNALQRAFLTVWNDLGINPAVPFENAEDDGLAAGPAAAFSANPSAAEVRFVHLDLAGLDRRMASTFLDQAQADFLKDQIHALARDISQFGCFASRQIHCKITQYLAKFLFTNSGTAIIAV